MFRADNSESEFCDTEYNNVFNKQQQTNHSETFESRRIESRTNMAYIDINLAINLVAEFDGDEKTLSVYIWGMRMLAEWINPADMAIFLLAVKLKLKKEAARALYGVDPNTFKENEDALIEHIRPENSIEIAHLKLSLAKQRRNESTEKFAIRIKELLHYINDSYDDDSNVLKKETERKAKRIFEDGLANYKLRNCAEAANTKTLKEAINYAIELELKLKFNRCRRVNQNFNQ